MKVHTHTHSNPTDWRRCYTYVLSAAVGCDGSGFIA